MPDGVEQGVDAERIARGLTAVRQRVATAAQAAGRDPADVRLVAVSKAQPADAIRAAAAAGQVDFGESRAQEFSTKLAGVGAGIRWHFVGQLQRNKVGQVVGRVALIHSVDRVALAEEIATFASRRDLCQDVLVQVNVAGETRKAGCAPSEVPGLLERITALDGITATGLMTIPPLDDDPAATFTQLRQMRAQLAPSFPQLAELSMGMSADLETAVASGATIVRVGTAIFGARPRNR